MLGNQLRVESPGGSATSLQESFSFEEISQNTAVMSAIVISYTFLSAWNTHVP